jgi:hypothetical protein
MLDQGEMEVADTAWRQARGRFAVAVTKLKQHGVQQHRAHEPQLGGATVVAGPQSV